MSRIYWLYLIDFDHFFGLASTSIFAKIIFMKSLFVVALLSLGLNAFAQADYVVTLKGDTLRGKVKILTYDRLDRVQVAAENKKQNFSALEARVVSFKGLIYHTISQGQGFRYMQLLQQGFLSLYAFRLENQSSYEGRYLAKKDGSGIEVPNLTFKKSLANFLNECPEVVERIKSGDFGKRDLTQIIERYNSCIQIITERKIEQPKQVITEKESDQMVALNSLITKVEASSIENKTDLLDLIKDLRSKVGRNEILPNYLLKDIKSQLGALPDFAADVEKLLLLLKK